MPGPTTASTRCATRAAHMMAAAVLELFPDAKLGIGPAIRDGFYYDFDLPRALTPADLEAIEERMREQVAADLPFERSELGTRRGHRPARTRADQAYKVEIIERAAGGEVDVSFYRHGDVQRPVPRRRTSSRPEELGAFKLLNSAGAYWRGDETPPDAAAHLRHGRGRPRRTSTSYLWRRGGGQEAGSPQARPRARPVHLPSRVAGRAVLASARHGPLAGARGLVAPGPARGRLRRGAHPEPGPQGAVGDLGPLGRSTRTTCSSWTTTTTSPG